MTDRDFVSEYIKWLKETYPDTKLSEPFVRRVLGGAVEGPASDRDLLKKALDALALSEKALFDERACIAAALSLRRDHMEQQEIDDLEWRRNFMSAAINEARAVLAEIKAALGSDAADGWQDISTAPKDGTLVDLWTGEYGRFTDCYWGLPSHSCGEYEGYCDSDWHGYEPGWVWGTLNEPVFETPTHWRLPPTAPNAARTELDAKEE